MNELPYLGLTGVAGAGKDTVCDRLVEIDRRFYNVSIVEPLKASVAALLGTTLRDLEEWKRDERVKIQVVTQDQINPYVSRSMTIRTFLQRYGTEAHRDVFGDDFWLDEWQRRCERIHAIRKPCTIVNTSVRFENEAERIIDLGGQVWEVVGPQDAGAAGHASESPLPSDLVAATIDNTELLLHDSGEPDYGPLDEQIQDLLMAVFA